MKVSMRRTSNEAALLERAVVGKRVRLVAVDEDEDASGGDARLAADDVGEVEHGQVAVNQLLDVGRVIARGVERHQTQTDIQIPATMFSIVTHSRAIIDTGKLHSGESL